MLLFSLIAEPEEGLHLKKVLPLFCSFNFFHLAEPPECNMKKRKGLRPSQAQKPKVKEHHCIQGGGGDDGNFLHQMRQNKF